MTFHRAASKLLRLYCLDRDCRHIMLMRAACWSTQLREPYLGSVIIKHKPWTLDLDAADCRRLNKPDVASVVRAVWRLAAHSGSGTHGLERSEMQDHYAISDSSSYDVITTKQENAFQDYRPKVKLHSSPAAESRWTATLRSKTSILAFTTILFSHFD